MFASVGLLAAMVLAFGGEDAVGQEGGESRSTSQSLRETIKYLASEELQGRSVTDDTIDLARDYIVNQMEQSNLKLDADEGDAFQSVPIEIGSQVNSAEKNFANVDFANVGIAGQDPETIKATLGDGFGPLAIGRDQASVSGRLLFAGYGITSQEHDYDDYLDVDAKDAVVLIMRKEPGASDPDSPFAGTQNTRHAFFATKIANAIEHGAAAVLVINDKASTREAKAVEQGRINDEERRRKRLKQLLIDLPAEAVKNRAATKQQIESVGKLIESMQADVEKAGRGVLGTSEAGTKTQQSSKIPVGSIARDLVDRILANVGKPSISELESQIDETFQPASQTLEGSTAKVSVDLKKSVVETDNVVGVLPGKGALANEAIVVGAHYDHVGMGGYASLAPGTIAVHNGADDNASGTAAMLASAPAIVERLKNIDSHRKVIFIAFTGEERGLLGSQYYVQHPVHPIETTAAMINLDMVGRLRDNELTVYGTGSADEMDSIVETANEKFGFNLFKVTSGYGPSDHQSFYRAGVPVLFFFTGLHNDYHRPSDDIDKIEFGNLTRITDMVSQAAFQLAVLPQRPRYAETDRRVEIRRQMTAYLGVRVSQTPGGVTLTEVTAGGPASQAGLQVGDLIQSIGKQQIRNTNDVLTWVRNHSPDDSFDINILRTGAPMTLRGKLEKRPE